MTQAKHTPGPWKRDKYGHIVDSNGDDVLFRSISIACSGGNHVAQAEANSDLTAAAPELLEALQAIVKSLVDQDEEGLIGHAEPIISARAAISKATRSAA